MDTNIRKGYETLFFSQVNIKSIKVRNICYYLPKAICKINFDHNFNSTYIKNISNEVSHIYLRLVFVSFHYQILLDLNPAPSSKEIAPNTKLIKLSFFR